MVKKTRFLPKSNDFPAELLKELVEQAKEVGLVVESHPPRYSISRPDGEILVICQWGQAKMFLGGYAEGTRISRILQAEKEMIEFVPKVGTILPEEGETE